jgi:geranylgeranyl pyrophosphate synthase
LLKSPLATRRFYFRGEYSLAKLFFQLVHNEIERMEELIHTQTDGYNPDLRTALELLLSAGGKRIRPTITFLTGKMLGANVEQLVTLAAAVEMLHTATLVHDDLIDGSLLRRGSPTLNSQWSPAATVLTGDFIFSRSAKLAAETNSVELMKVFAQTLTIIVNGEMAQLFNRQNQMGREDYFKRIYAKTASLFETSARTAALISSAAEKTTTQMSQFGYNIGIAFQIIDDILDFTGEQTTLGKPIGSDLRQGIITLPVICFGELHQEDDAVKTLLADRLLESDQVQPLIDAILKSEAIQLAYHEAQVFTQKAVKNLESLPDCPESRALAELALYIVERNS